MRVMLFGKATEISEKAAPPTAEAFAAMDRFIEELVKAGVFVAAAGLKNNAQAKRIVCDGPGRTVIDGPFAEARELVAGFQIWEVKDMDEALAWAKCSPNPMPGKSELEIRPFYEAADLAEFVTPDDVVLGGRPLGLSSAGRWVATRRIPVFLKPSAFLCSTPLS